jgi:hypothetical protein
MSYRIEAVHNLFSKVHHGDGEKFYSINGGEITFSSSEEKQIDAEVLRLEKEYSDNEYSRNRASAYDSIGDQLDMIYKDNLNGTTTHKASVEAVKAKFPKPE